MQSNGEIKLTGCTAEPLINYLKALGVFRIVAEQKDKNTKGCWRNGEFVLKSSLPIQKLLDFFIYEYKPTPVIVPWSGADFFGINISGNNGPYRKTPSAKTIIEAFMATKSGRLSEYRNAITCAMEVLKLSGITRKDQMKDKTKARFISVLRSKSNEGVVRWVDACAVMTSEKASFSALLGSGGGSDGNTHFSDNFMQNLWDVLPDFDIQRIGRKQISDESLKNALLGIPFSGLVPKRTSTLYDGGAVGGPNAGQGFERDSFGNPWSIILCIEGTIMLAGSITRRHGVSSGVAPSFPFQTRLTPTSADSSSDKESFGREVWLPLWNTLAGKGEIEILFSEGRANVGRKISARGVDFARAATGLGVDRGIRSFQRYGIVKGRVGGDNYNTSTSFGLFDVRARTDVDLLKETDRWLDQFRRAASGDKEPPRFRSALRRIETAIFAFCKFGGAARFAEILCAFGNAERQLAMGEKFREKWKLHPIFRLSPEWLRAADDNSIEFQLARALAGIYDSEKKVEPIRSNFEPVFFGKWKEGGFCDVWNSAGLSNNLQFVLERRLVDAEKLGCQGLPLASRHKVTINAIATYIVGDVDDGRIEELLWGMILVDHHKPLKNSPPILTAGESREEGDNAVLMPRPYSLLKLLFLPDGLNVGGTKTNIRPEPAITALLRAGRTKEACAIAARRLKAGGLTPMTYHRGGKILNEADWQSDGIEPMRLGAALLFPISDQDINQLKQMVIKPNN